LNTLLIGALFFRLDFRRNQIFGVLIGLVGSALLIWNGAVHHPNQNYYYAFLVLIASICYATNVNLIKKYLSDLPPLSITTGNFLVLLFPALAVLYSTDFFSMTYGAAVQESVLYILILGVLGTGIANIIFFKLIQISSPVFATSVTYLIPVVAFFWGMLDQELLTPVQLFGAFIVLVGVYLSARK
jgi:drug/metabolite transporter (DMT)-like permease